MIHQRIDLNLCFSQANEQLGLPVRNARTSNAGISIQNVFNPNGGLSTAGSQIYGHTGQTNATYEDEDVGADVEGGGGSSLRMNPRNQVSWSNRL